MARRSPFGERILDLRRHRGWSQEALARRIVHLADQGTPGIEGKVSVKTIYNHEAECADPGEFAVPRVGTVGIYAEAFQLPPDSPERRRLIEAAEETRRLKAMALRAAAPACAANQQEVIGRVAEPTSADFVVNGREQAWSRLQRQLAAVLRGEPQVALLEGEAGIGKTRLLIELGRRAEAAEPRLVVAVGRCLTSAPYHAVREILALLIGEREGMGSAQLVTPQTAERLRVRAGSAIEAVLERGPGLVGTIVNAETFNAQVHAAEPAGSPWRERAVGLLHHPMTADPAALLTQTAAVLREYAAGGPVVLIFDDLHQAAAGTISLFTLLSRRLRHASDLPVFLLGAYRSRGLRLETEADGHPLLPALIEIQRRWDDAMIDVGAAATPAAGRAYVDGRLDLVPNRLDAAFRDELVRKTSGIPLFVENALRMLHGRGQLQFDESGALVFAGSVVTLDLPPTTRAIIGERLRDLSREARRALEFASVQGEQFLAEPVATVLHLERPAAARLFDGELGAEGQLIIPAGTITVAGKRLHRYQFAHAVYREYLTERLGPMQREHHLRETAQALSAAIGTGESELSATIAELFEQAGDHAAAAEHHEHAGTYDLNRQNPESAAAHFERVLVLADRKAQQEIVGHAMLGLGLCLRKEGEFQRAVHRCQAALAYGRAIGSTELEAYTLSSLGLLGFDLGDLATAEGQFIAALPMLRQLGDQRGECEAEGLLGHVCYGLGQYDAATAHADRSLFLANQLGDEALAAESRLVAANCLLDLGCFEEAIATFDEAITRYRHDHDHRGEAICWADIGLCQIGLEDWDAAMDALGQARAIGEELTIVGLTPLIEVYSGLVYEGRGEWRAAWRAYADALRLRRRAGQDGLAIDALAGLLRVSIARRRWWFTRRIVWGIGRWLETHGAEGIEEPFRVAVSCVTALDILGEQSAAARLLEASVALLHERAGQVASTAQRTSYLHRVPANRALLALAESLLGSRHLPSDAARWSGR